MNAWGEFGCLRIIDDAEEDYLYLPVVSGSIDDSTITGNKSPDLRCTCRKTIFLFILRLPHRQIHKIKAAMSSI